MERIVSAISEVLNLPVMAEGVETEAQRDWLLQRGIRNGQGFLFAKPLPREVFEVQFCPRTVNFGHFLAVTSPVSSRC